MQNENLLQWDIQQNSECIIVTLIGELNRNTLMSLWKQRYSFLSPNKGQHIYWHLQGLTNVDSAGFTLLAELFHHYNQTNTSCITNMPENVRKLAELFDLSNWLSPFLCTEKK